MIGHVALPSTPLEPSMPPGLVVLTEDAVPGCILQSTPRRIHTRLWLSFGLHLPGGNSLPGSPARFTSRASSGRAREALSCHVVSSTWEALFLCSWTNSHSFPVLPVTV